ncbi:MAG: Arc family DNA-binding protein [Stellaceae bacterium]
MATKPRSERETVMTVRLPRELHEHLKKAAEAGEGGIAAELRRRLEQSFEAPVPNTDPRFADLLTTAAYAVAAASRMFPAKKIRASRTVAGHMFPGERIDEKGREVEDISAHWLVEACLLTLIDAFRPPGLPASLPPGHGAAQAEVVRRADRIVGAALGTLGDRGIAAFSRLAPVDQETIAASGPIGRRLAAEAEKYSDEGGEP